MKKAFNFVIKLLSNKYFIFLLTFILILIDLKDVNILFSSGDSAETVKVFTTMLSKDPTASYVMYKGIYAFIPGLLSYYFSKLTGLTMFFLLKILKAFSFAYLSAICIPNIIEYLFNYKVQAWQKYLFIILVFVLEKGNIYLLSVDLTSTLILFVIINEIVKCIGKVNLFRIVFIGALIGIEISLSGQFTISAFIMLVYLIGFLLKNYSNNFLKLITIILVLFIGISITKIPAVLYEKKVVDSLRDKGEWIPTGHDWAIHGLTYGMKIISYPSGLDDKVSDNFIKYDNAELYNYYIEGAQIYTPNYYFKLIIKHPAFFIYRWTIRLYLGIINDPINSMIYPNKLPTLTILFMASTMYVIWSYIRKHLKKFNDLFTLPSFMFFSILFSSLVPSFRHVENRYYLSARIAVIAVFVLSPLLTDYFKKIKNKEVKISNINMSIITCLAFAIICLVVYFAIYQNNSNITVLF